jgi:hypothetical protein
MVSRGARPIWRPVLGEHGTLDGLVIPIQRQVGLDRTVPTIVGLVLSKIAERTVTSRNRLQDA